MKLVDRAKNELVVPRRLGDVTNGVHPAISILLLESLVQSRWGYFIHLTRWTRKVADELKKWSPCSFD